MARAQTIAYDGYDASALALPRLFTPPASLAGKLAGAYVLSSKDWNAPYFDWSGNDRTLVPTGVSVGEAPPSLSSTAYLTVPLTGDALVGVSGKCSLIAVSRSNIGANSMLISNYATSGNKISIAAEGSATRAYSTYTGSPTNPAITNEARGGSWEMCAATFAPAKVQVYRKRAYAQAQLSFAAVAVAGTTLTIGGSVIAYVASGATGAQINIGASAQGSTDNTAAYINANSATLGVTAVTQGATIILVANTKGTGGNGITLAASGANPTFPRGNVTVGASSLLTASASTASSVGGGLNNFRIGASFDAATFAGPATIAAALLVTDELTQAQLDTVYSELAIGLSDYVVDL